MPDDKIKAAIEAYLDSRRKILRLGQEYPELIGGNDNIIGRVGEFIALRFLESLGQHPTKAEGKSNPGFDLIDTSSGWEIKTQVKVISSENEKGRSVRLTDPWDQFVLIRLDEDYQPSTIGLLKKNQHKLALKENTTWSPRPIVKLSMLGEKGLIGKYGKIYHDFGV